MPAPHFEIIIPIVACATVAFIVIIVVIWRQRFGKKDDVIPQLGLDGIIPSDSRGRRKSGNLTPHALADIERAQKFRERARTVAVGRPKFKTSRKNRPGSFKAELSYSTLENHQFGDKITFRRISEDRTSAYSATDIENNSGVVMDEDHSFSSYDYRRIIGQVKEEEESKV